MQHAKQADFKPFDASDWRIGIVTAQFNQHITGALQASAVERASDYGITGDNIDIVPVAGAIEIPLVLQALARSGRYDVLLAIGCVIRGATPHFDFVCKFVSEGILRVQLDEHLPVAYGILTCNSEAEALERTTLGKDHLDAVMHQARVIGPLVRHGDNTASSD
jgi:6,7-dimethyl-8-ribityllumazine synthase